LGRRFFLPAGWVVAGKTVAGGLWLPGLWLEAGSAAAGRSSRRASRGALGSGIVPTGPAGSERPVHARPEGSIPAAFSWHAACASALRIIRRPQSQPPPPTILSL